MEVSSDGEVLCVSFKGGYLNLYEINRNFARIEQKKFELPYNFEFINFLCESPMKALDFYQVFRIYNYDQVLLSDIQANSVKMHVSIFKMFDKRATKLLVQ